MGQGSCEKPVSQEKKRFQWRRIILKSFRRAWKAISVFEYTNKSHGISGNTYFKQHMDHMIWYYILKSKNNPTKNKNEGINSENNCYVKVWQIIHCLRIALKLMVVNCALDQSESDQIANHSVVKVSLWTHFLAAFLFDFLFVHCVCSILQYFSIVGQLFLVFISFL